MTKTYFEGETSMDRRNFLGLGLGVGGGTLLAGCGAAGHRSESRVEDSAAARKKLNEVASRPVLRLGDLNEPVIIDDIPLLSRGSDTFVHVRSKEGAEGISLTNGRDCFHAVLDQRVIPHFINSVRTRSTKPESNGMATGLIRP
jgi:hypothetical protein